MKMSKKNETPSADDSTQRPCIALPAEQGEFMHQAEEAESSCVTTRPAPHCECGMYDLEWAG